MSRGGGEGNGAVGDEPVRPDRVGEWLVLVSVPARADWPAWHLTGGPELPDRALIRINTRFRLI